MPVWAVLCFRFVACVNWKIVLFVAHLREVFLPRTQMESFPQGTSRLLVIVPDHFHIPNYFNQSFSHMDSFLSLVRSHPLFFSCEISNSPTGRWFSGWQGEGHQSSLAFLCEMRSAWPRRCSSRPCSEQRLMNISGGMSSFK